MLMKIYFILVLIVTSISIALGNDSLNKYQLFTGIGHRNNDNKPIIVIRSFTRDSSEFYLTVNPYDLSTNLLNGKDIELKQESWDIIKKEFESSAYIKTLKRACNDSALKSAGITHLAKPTDGIILSVDLCPSERPMDRILFIEAVNSTTVKPLPIAIAITGSWIKHHKQDFEWLRTINNNNEINITWINHTYHHNTGKHLEVEEHFLEKEEANLNSEVFGLEKYLIKNNIVPSVFFRFPALVSDKKIQMKIINYGLIPLGTNAWIAKDQKPKPGSIVLIHANGNEPLGIKKFLKMLKENINSEEKWQIMDLKKSIVEDEQ